MTGWIMDRDWVDVFPIENEDIPASYVSFRGCKGIRISCSFFVKFEQQSNRKTEECNNDH